MRDHSISVDQARYATSIVAKYLDTAIFKVSTKFYKNTFPADMIFTKEDVSTSDEKVEKLTRELYIHYRACIGSLIYLLSTRVDLSFSVHRLAKFLANPGKVHFEGLIHLLRYIRDNKNLGLKYYAMSIRIYQLKGHSISVYQARYATSIVAKYLDTATVKVIKTFYKTTFPADIIFTKEDVSTSDEQV